jgi:CspA family cold shock protein
MEFGSRASGTVQWFSRVKGYGFIRPDGQEEDVFVHYSSIVGEGYRNLRRGQKVEFTMEDSDKGPQAVDVTEIAGEEGFSDKVGIADDLSDDAYAQPAAISAAADEGEAAEAAV